MEDFQHCFCFRMVSSILGVLVLQIYWYKSIFLPIVLSLLSGLVLLAVVLTCWGLGFLAGWDFFVCLFLKCRPGILLKSDILFCFFSLHVFGSAESDLLVQQFKCLHTTLCTILFLILCMNLIILFHLLFYFQSVVKY